MRTSLVDFADLRVQGPKIIKYSESEKSQSEQVKNSRAPFPHVKPVNTQPAEKSQQQPGHSVIDWAGCIAQSGLAMHGWYEKEINNPADEQQARSEEPDGSRNRPAIVKAM